MAKDKTKTVEKVLTREEVARAIDKVELSPEEELVVRLRYGIGLDPDARLEFRGKGNDELEARLALIEKAILDLLEEGVDQQADRSVLDKFKDL